MRNHYIIGIDEAGRGPISGPVAVGLVMVEEDNQKALKKFRDSKQLTEKKREEFFNELKNKNIFYTYSLVGSEIVDSKGIVFAINKGIKNCLSRVEKKNIKILLDGSLKAPIKYKNQRTIIKGDEKVSIISAASIVAKVVRDRRMIKLSAKYPGYNFEKHKGYGTTEHYKIIKRKGLTKIHRKSFIGL